MSGVQNVLADRELLGDLAREYERLKASGGHVDYRSWIQQRLAPVFRPGDAYQDVSGLGEPGCGSHLKTFLGSDKTTHQQNSLVKSGMPEIYLERVVRYAS
jgi:hypothetical protein